MDALNPIERKRAANREANRRFRARHRDEINRRQREIYQPRYWSKVRHLEDEVVRLWDEILRTQRQTVRVMKEALEAMERVK